MKARPSILIFSPSTRRAWLNPPAKWLNPGYWLIARLAADLSTQFTTYTVSESLAPQGRLLPYAGQRVDAMVSIGASYDPATCKCAKYDPNFSRHKRIFDIAEAVSIAKSKGDPLHINMCVDVRKWFPELTKALGTEPDTYVTEQEMKWQQAGFLANDKFFHSSKRPKRDIFVFTGGAKTRAAKFKCMTDGIDMEGYVLGGGWDTVDINPQFKKMGFMKYIDSIPYMLDAKWGAVVHEDIGDNSNWITAKLFEHMGSRTVGLIHPNYDSEGWYVPKDYPLRVGTPREAAGVVKRLGYEKCLALQNKLVRKEWSDYNQFYLAPFIKRIERELKSA